MPKNGKGVWGGHLEEVFPKERVFQTDFIYFEGDLRCQELRDVETMNTEWTGRYSPPLRRATCPEGKKAVAE